MNKFNIKIFSIILLLFIVSLTLVSCKRQEIEVPGFSEDTIKIGALGPLTGAAAVYGRSVFNCARLAVNEINANGGLDGVMLSFEMYNDQHRSELVNQGYAHLLERGMQLSLGTVTTKPGLEFKELSAIDGIFALTPSASGDLIPGGNVFQMCFADSNQGTASAHYFNENYKGKKIGVFYKSDDEYSRGILEKFEAAIDKSFGTLAKASFKGDEADFSQQLQALKDCDVIFMPIYYTPASQFMTAAKGTIKPNAVYYGCDGLDGIESIAGFDISSITQEISYLSHFNSVAGEGAAAELIKKYSEVFDADAEPLNQFGASAYDCVYAIFDAMKEAISEGKTIDGSTPPAELCEILSAKFSGGFVYNGVTGRAEENGKSSISWNPLGFVNKEAIKHVVKEADV